MHPNYNRLSAIKLSIYHYKVLSFLIRFFEYSLNSLKENGFEILEYTRDLYSNLPSDNVATEYEQKFVLENKNINMLKAKIKG